DVFEGQGLQPGGAGEGCCRSGGGEGQAEEQGARSESNERGRARRHLISPMLEMRGISKSYGNVKANDGIDLTVPSGSIVGLLGANGSGKSTLMKCLFGMVQPDSGGIVFKGRELGA